MRPMRLDAPIESYLDYLTCVCHQPPREVADVRSTMQRICEAMSRHHPDVPLWQLGLPDYIQWIAQERQQARSPVRLNNDIRHLRDFLDHAWRSGRSDRNVLDGFRSQDAKQYVAICVLSWEEVRQIIECCPQGTPVERRDRMVLLLLYGCGLRTREVCGLNFSDVDRERGELSVRKAKGDIQRVVPVPRDVQTELWAYLLDREDTCGALFWRKQKKGRISSRGVRLVVQQAAQRAKIGRQITPRILRYTYAKHLMDLGVDAAIISLLMGDRSPAEQGVHLYALEDWHRRAVTLLPWPGHGEDAP
jgi:site-specific recombinase XerD